MLQKCKLRKYIYSMLAAKMKEIWMANQKVSKKQANEALKKGAKKVTEDDLQKVIDKQKEIEEKFKGNGPLGRFVADLKLLFSNN